jgi:thiamine biosynthesis lipoprotein ApbE
VTLELWLDPEDGRPLRGAGTLISAVTAEADGLATRIAFFRWSVEGREGLGHYEIARTRG